MEKTFEDFLAEAVSEINPVDTEQTEDTSTTVEDTEVTADETEDSNTIVEETPIVEESKVETSTTEDRPDFKAFADMRVKNKQAAEENEKLQSELLKAEALAKKLKFSSIDEMLAEASKRELLEESERTKVPVEYLEKLKALEDANTRREQEMTSYKREQKEVGLISTLDKFVESNKVNKQDFEVTLNALEADGFTYESLLELPLNAVERLLSSYTNTKESTKQKELAEKAKLTKEIPMTPKDKNDGAVPNRVDEIFAYMSGQKRDF